MSHQIQEIALAEIVASRTNPRKTFKAEALSELADDIKENGVQQAILIRPAPGGLPLGEHGIYEIVFGERRYRASALAGIATIPARVRELSDQQALEIQMVENIQRADLDPVEESEGYQSLLDFRDGEGHAVYTVEMLAEKVKKDPSYIHRRLKLRHLPTVAREALLAGVLPISTATLIARIPGEEMRKTAAQEIIKPKYEDGPLSRDKAQKFINENFMRQLKGAPFDTTDPTLIPKMGPCTTCPFRTGNATELYGDLQRTDICTNPPCFGRKSETTWTRVQANAEKEKKRVLSEKETEGVFNYSNDLSWNAPYVELNKQPKTDDLTPGTKRPPSWKKLIAGSPCEVEVILARDGAGRVRELVKRDQAIEAARQASTAKGVPDIIAPERKSTQDDAYKKQQKAVREKAKLEQKISRSVMQALVTAIEEDGDRPMFLEWSAAIMATAIKHAGYEGCYWVKARRQLEAKSTATENMLEAVETYASTLAEPQQAALVVELLLAGMVRAYGHEAKIMEPWIALYGINVETITAAVKNEGKPKAKAKAKKKEKPAPATDAQPIVFKWDTQKEDVKAFDWNEQGIAESPDVVRFSSPAQPSLKLVALVGVARGESGWHFGWETGGVKPTWKTSVPCSNTSLVCLSRDDALREALDQVLTTKKLKKAPPEILAHIEHLIASIPVADKIV